MLQLVTFHRGVNMKSLIVVLLTMSFSAFAGMAPEKLKTVESVKTELVKVASQYIGQGDPDFKIQNELMPYVERLLELAPQEPIKNRLDLLAGAWQQVWGPYEYRKNDRSVDPTTDVNNIYQVVFPDGYYYNVTNNLNRFSKDIRKVTLLRGEFNVNGGDDLKVQFNKLTSIKKLPENLRHVDLPALSESNELAGEKTDLSSELVKRFFKGGILSEVYTDADLRITIGQSDDENGVQGYLYVLKRVK